MTTLLYDYYLASVKDALKNLEGDDLEKCLTALNNYMKKYGYARNNLSKTNADGEEIE